MRRLLLATCAALPEGDDDAELLTDALAAAGVQARWAVWDDAAVDWSAAPVLLRSVWDYTTRRAEFLAWLDTVPRVDNPAAVVAWSTDKTYLLDLAAAGVPVTPTSLFHPGEPLPPTGSAEVVVKPSVGAGSRGAGRFRAEDPAARTHADALHAAGRTVLVQPYLDGVDEHGETALLYFDGRFSHAVRKGPMLSGRGSHPLDETSGLWIEENISARTPSPAELAVGERALQEVARRFGGPLRYARIDLLPASDGPVVVELELVEPSFFLGFDPDAAGRVAAAVVGAA